MKTRRLWRIAVKNDDDPATQCLAAFYLLAAGKDAEAEAYLRRGGKEAGSLRAAFK